MRLLSNLKQSFAADLHSISPLAMQGVWFASLLSQLAITWTIQSKYTCLLFMINWNHIIFFQIYIHQCTLVFSSLSCYKIWCTSRGGFVHFCKCSKCIYIDYRNTRGENSTNSCCLECHTYFATVYRLFVFLLVDLVSIHIVHNFWYIKFCLAKPENNKS